MTTKYLTNAETSKLVRQSLKEAFPDVKFSVRGKTYSGGSSVSVSWTDGPNEAQVEAVMADWWTATPAQYLEGVPKAKMIEAVTEACGEAEARDLAKMKKGEAVAAAAAKLDGKRWLPAPLRRSASVARADDQDDTTADDEESTEE